MLNTNHSSLPSINTSSQFQNSKRVILRKCLFNLKFSNAILVTKSFFGYNKKT